MSSSLGRLRLFILTLLAAVTAFTIIGSSFYQIDYCTVERVKSNHSVLLYTLVIIIVSGLLISFWRPVFPSGRNVKRPIEYKRSLFYIIYTYLWYGATYCICYAGKYILNDTMCHKDPNSISGHFLYHIFFALAIPYWFISVGRLYYKDNQLLSSSSPNTKPSSVVLRHEFKFLKNLILSGWMPILMISLYIIYLVLSYMNLEKTYVLGYHSPRQILYGVILCLLSFYSLLGLTATVNKRSDKGLNYLMLVLSVLWIIGPSLIYFVVKRRFPFGKLELTLAAIGYGYLLFVSSKGLDHIITKTIKPIQQIIQPKKAPHYNPISSSKKKKKID
ncbi:hypothetical protein DFA_11954 [Cavenderia fasciculata]|uniref:Uncharacterized protein n=1 Tax=Cavenderia fasciculata TaxID=261658 RepID=F4QEX8_CACFS|nr:uncharacterized protein DFA_11954 [Cavenderia fasciculata]EGG14185.1 hypothetical protein DFA_11954 [Cavenderia fasciculata]|eukprot:XP_004350893.1 hypothetical protein DFA_11954 [Cavenderia fasciculata]